MILLLLINSVLSISEKTKLIPQSVTQRTLELYYQKDIDQPINIGLDGEYYNTKNTLPPFHTYMKFTLEANKQHTLSVIAVDEEHLNELYIFAAWIYDDIQSEFFYFQQDWQVPRYSDRPQYHLSAPRMWINDPNGLIYINGEYHVFYQYNPLSIQWGNMYWGHAISADGVTWRSLPIALTPGSNINSNETIGGAFSGGSVEWNGNIVAYYTDSVETTTDFIEVQNYSISYDGVHFSNYTTVIDQRPLGASKDFRDPIVYYTGTVYLLLLGTAMDGIPSIIKYKSNSPLGPWTYDGILYQQQLSSTTIECPNILKPSNSDLVVLFFSINDEELNSSIALYMIGTLTENNEFITEMEPIRMDWGGHFYAAQSYGDLLISWMQDWKKDPKYLGNDQYSGIFTLLRKGYIENERLYQKVVDGAYKLIKSRTCLSSESYIWPSTYLSFTYSVNEWELAIIYNTTRTIYIGLFTNRGQLGIKEEGQTIFYSSDSNLHIGEQNRVEIWLDIGAIEVFINSGEAVFSQRFLFSEDIPKIVYPINGLIDCEIGEIKSIY